MANSSAHHVVSTIETWNWRLNFSTQECQMNYNLSNKQTKHQNSQTKDDLTTSVLSSGELSSSSRESQVKKKEVQERRRKKKEKKRVKEERRRKKEERRRKGNIKKHAEDCINPPSPAYKRVKRTLASERFARNAHDGSKFKDIATWVALKATRTKLIDDAWVATSTLNSQNGEVTINDLYEAISSDEDSLLDFTPTPSEANLTLPSNDQSESEVAASVKKLSREELEKVAIRHIAMCEKYTKNELELDMCKGREETFHSRIFELNQEVIKLKSMIPPSKTTRSIGVQMQLDSSSGQQNSSSILHPFLTRIKIEKVEGNSDKESITSNENSSNNLHTHPSVFGSSVLRAPVSSVNENQIHSVVKEEKS